MSTNTNYRTWDKLRKGDTFYSIESDLTMQDIKIFRYRVVNVKKEEWDGGASLYITYKHDTPTGYEYMLVVNKDGDNGFGFKEHPKYYSDVNALKDGLKEMHEYMLLKQAIAIGLAHQQIDEYMEQENVDKATKILTRRGKKL